MSASTDTAKRLFVESDMEQAEIVTVDAGQVAALCRRCPGKVEPNDDSAGIVQTESGGLVLVVADGVGGCPQGHKASAIAVQSVISHVLDADPNGDLRSAILDGIETANSAILELGIGAATTLAVIEIQHGSARAYQVGDSTTLIIGGRGAVKWKSTAHSPVGYALESGMIDEADAMEHDERHLVSNLVGSRTMHIEIGPVQQLAPRDTIIVGSDGLFDNLQLDEVVQRCRKGKLVDRVGQIGELAAARMSGSVASPLGKPDDLSVLIFSRAGRGSGGKANVPAGAVS